MTPVSLRHSPVQILYFPFMHAVLSRINRKICHLLSLKALLRPSGLSCVHHYSVVLQASFRLLFWDHLAMCPTVPCILGHQIQQATHQPSALTIVSPALKESECWQPHCLLTIEEVTPQQLPFCQNSIYMVFQSRCGSVELDWRH